jgi:hypothetical protein
MYHFDSLFRIFASLQYPLKASGTDSIIPRVSLYISMRSSELSSFLWQYLSSLI